MLLAVAASSGRRAASRPADRVVGRLPRSLRGFVERLRHEQAVLDAAGLAFYALVSAGPAVVVAMWVTGLVLGEERLHRVADQVGRIAPQELGADRALRGVATQGTTAGVAAVLLALWPGSAYGSGLVRAFDRASDRRDRRRTPFLGRVLAVTLLLPMLALGSVALAYLGATALGDEPLAAVAGIPLALASGFAGAIVVSAVVYRVFPPDRMSWSEVWRASAIAAGGSSVASVVLVAFVSLGADFEEHYASSGLAAVVLLAVWLFVSNLFLVVGYQVAVGDGRRRWR
jgi:membrane protein